MNLRARKSRARSRVLRESQSPESLDHENRERLSLAAKAVEKEGLDKKTAANGDRGARINVSQESRKNRALEGKKDGSEAAVGKRRENDPNPLRVEKINESRDVVASLPPVRKHARSRTAMLRTW